MVKQVLVLWVLLCSCSLSWAGSDKVILRMHGSNTVGAQLGPALVKRWLAAKGYTGISQAQTAPEEALVSARDPQGRPVGVEIHAHGSSTSFRDLAAGTADVGMASRPIKEGELQRLARFGRMDSPAAEYVVGLDGIAIIVNRKSALNALDKATIRRIFAGQIADWAQVGGAPGPIRVYARDNKSGTFDTFKSLVLGKGTPLVADARRYESNAKLSDDVARDPDGIGFVGMPYIREAKALAVSDGQTRPIRPGAFAVATEDYALARRLHLYVPEQGATPLAREFAEYAVSTEGQAIVESTGFVSQRIIAGGGRTGEGLPEEYLALTEGAEHLSLHFRFQKSSIALDTKAVRDLDRLVAYMAQPQSNGRRLMLLGFADHDEVIPYRSLSLSIERADVVADQLIRKGLAPLRVRGFGSAVPVASNEEPAGRRKNRRVEVWVR